MIIKQFNTIDADALKEQTVNLSVSVEFSEHTLAIALFDKIVQKFTSFESWFTEEKNLSELTQVFLNSEIMKLNVPEVAISLLMQEFVHIPKELFIPEEATEYLNYTVSSEYNGTVSFDEIPAISALCCYKIPEHISAQLEQFNAKPTIRHFSGNFISLIADKINTDQKTVVVFFHENAFEIVLMHNKKLIQYSTFTFQTIQEYLYFLLLFLQQLNLDTETVNFIVTGGIEEKSALMNATLKYIRNVSSFRFTDHTMFTETLQSVPKNRFDMLFQNAIKK